MKIIFTGSSSFTGYWFIKKLTEAGHEVLATFSGDPLSYEGIRAHRVAAISVLCNTEFNAPFGSDRFLGIIASEPSWDLLSHHAAAVRNYRSSDFDITKAVAENTMNARNSFRLLNNRGCGRVVVTGSIFEEGEGVGSDDVKAFSAYGISKGVTAEILAYYCRELGIHFRKFVIPNPFGPWEDERFTSYLVKSWISGVVPEVKTPIYVRDNIHVQVLAARYLEFAECANFGYISRMNPSGYAESIGSFVARLAKEVEKRIGISCKYIICHQKVFSEPELRINTDPTNSVLDNIGENELFDEYIGWYQSLMHL